MAWTDAEIARVVAIEEMLNTIQTAINNLMSKQQMRQLLLLRQQEIDVLNTKVASLESQITALQKAIV